MKYIVQPSFEDQSFYLQQKYAYYPMEIKSHLE